MKTRRSCICCLSASLLLFGISTGGRAGTIVGGMITADTHWSLAGAPYIATQSVLVSSGATLQIDPGVEVRFDPQRALSIVSGQLLAQGTETQQIRFTANVEGPVTDADRWGYIGFGDASVNATFDPQGNYTGGSILEHTIIEYAGATAIQGAVSLADSSPYISHSDIRNNSNGGIYAMEADGVLRISGNTITNNWMDEYQGGAGISLYWSNAALISDNVITQNTANKGRGGGVKLEDSDDAVISGNTIANNEAQRGGGLYLYDSWHTTISDNTISYNEASEGGGGIHLRSLNETSFSSSGNVITHNSAASGGGVYLGGGHGQEMSTMTGDLITANTGDGVFLEFGRIALSIDPANPSWIYGNSGYEVRNNGAFQFTGEPDGLNNIDGQNVFWGTMDEAEIQAGIYDFFDDGGMGVVFYEPWAVPELIPGDTDFDGDVDFTDFNNLANNYTGADGIGKVWGQGDFDLDGDVDFADFNDMANHYTGALKMANVPEPSTLVLLAMGSVGLLAYAWRRRRLG